MSQAPIMPYLLGPRPVVQPPRRVDPPVVAGRVPPHDLDAEAAVLSAAMLDRDALDLVLETLKPEHFYSEANARIYQACQALAVVSTPIDVVSVASWLRDREWLAKVGGSPYLGHLVDATPAVGHVQAHAKVVFEKWRLRQLITTCQTTAAAGYGDVGETQAFIDAHEGAVFALGHEGRAGETSTVIARDAVQECFSEMVAAAESGRAVVGIPTGYDRLDDKMSGLHEGDLTIVAARPGMGKALAEDALVLTPLGWRTMGSLRTGDLVVGSDGEARRVLGVFDQGEKPVFRVTLRDGGSVECCDEHLWLTRTRAERCRGGAGGVRSTAQIRATLARGKDGGLNHSLPMMRPAQLAPLGPLPLAPYLLGVLLGDGCTRNACVGIDNPEQDIRQRVVALLPGGDAVTADDDGLHLRIRREKRNNEPSTTKQLLEALGLVGCLSWQKFIPELYLRASVEDRIALLQGLCDTDGHVEHTGTMVEFSTTSPQMVAGVRFLVGSLGGLASVSEKLGHYTKGGERVTTRTAYRVRISFPAGGVCPVSSAKHLARWKARPRRIVERFIASIEPAGRKRCLCIAVDAPDQLYVCNDFIVTHNTSFVLNVAVNVAAPRMITVADPKDNGRKIERLDTITGACVFSLEMPRKQIGHRLLCSEARVDLGKSRASKLHDSDWRKMIEAAKFIGSLPLWVDDTPALTLLQLRAKIRRIQAEFNRAATDTAPEQKVGLVMVDYLQLMKGRDGVQNREQEISEISRGLKGLAKELKVPVIALSQLNRSVETRGKKDKRPMLSDLRESGAIEQDADNILFIYRDDYYNPDTSELKGIAEIIVAKQRNGATGPVKVAFNAACTRFDNLEPGQYPENDEDP